jgi:transcriptional regulator with XRE-family HTH domain
VPPSETIFANLGRALTLLRELRGLTQAQAARKAGIGKSQLSKYENLKELPKLDSLEKMLHTLGIGYLEFFHTLKLIDRRQSTLGQEEPTDMLVVPGLSEDLNSAFESVFVLMARLQRMVWEDALDSPKKK